MSISNDRDELLKRLDTVIAILQLAFKDSLDAARQEILSDPISASILDATAGDWIDAGELRRRVSRETNQSERTVSRRVASLIAQRALDQAGAGPKTRYRSTGLI